MYEGTMYNVRRLWVTGLRAFLKSGAKRRASGGSYFQIECKDTSNILVSPNVFAKKVQKKLAHYK